MVVEWRSRLREAIEMKGTTMRALSLKAVFSEAFVHSLLVRGQEPTIDKLIQVADTLGVTMSWLLNGYEIGPAEERLLQLFAKLPEKQRQAILDLASFGDANA